jgi:hypothetical protein
MIGRAAKLANLSNKINPTESTNQLIWTALRALNTERRHTLATLDLLGH